MIYKLIVPIIYFTPKFKFPDQTLLLYQFSGAPYTEGSVNVTGLGSYS